MIRIDLQLDLHYDIDAYGADFVFNIHAAHTACQTVLHERLNLSQALLPEIYTDPATRNRYMRLRAQPGHLHVSYAAVIDLHHHLAEPSQIGEVPVHQLPPDVIGYIYPSRYCQSDQFTQLANTEFGQLWQGYERVMRIQEWVQRHVKFTSNTSNANTSAIETLKQGTGVCRDFTHLMITLCRALNIPARFTTGTDYGADPVLGPPDFHAYVEVYLGHRWYIFDPSGTAIPMGLIRFGTGRDAADVAFATIFGGVQSQAPQIRAVAVEDKSRQLNAPQHTRLAVSTDDALRYTSQR
jgi:hypothetical protein